MFGSGSLSLIWITYLLGLTTSSIKSYHIPRLEYFCNHLSTHQSFLLSMPATSKPSVLAISQCMSPIPSTSSSGFYRSDFRLPFLSHITHLRIIDPCCDWMHWSDIELLPRLTDIVVEVEIAMLEECKIFANRVTTILLCRMLQVFKSLYQGLNAARKTGGRLSRLVNDIRIVHLLILQYDVSDWGDGARGGPDMW